MLACCDQHFQELCMHSPSFTDGSMDVDQHFYSVTLHRTIIFNAFNENNIVFICRLWVEQIDSSSPRPWQHWSSVVNSVFFVRLDCIRLHHQKPTGLSDRDPWRCCQLHNFLNSLHLIHLPLTYSQERGVHSGYTTIFPQSNNMQKGS